MTDGHETPPSGAAAAAGAPPARDRGGWTSRLLTLFHASRGPVARGALVSVLLTAGGTGIGYLVQIFVSRTLGAHAYGTYAYALGILNVAALVATLDLGGGALRFVGYYAAAHEWALLRGFTRLSRRLAISLSATAAAVGALTLVLLRDRFEPDLVSALLAVCALLVPTCLLQLDFNLLQALRRVYETRVPSLFVRPLGFVLVLWLATAVFDAPRTAASAVLANAAGSVAALALSTYFVWRVWPRPARSVAPETRTGEWLRFSAASLGSSLLYLILSQQSDVIIVGSVIDRKSAGLYSAASQISSLVLFGVGTVNQFASPLLAEYQGRPAAPGLRALMKNVMLLNWAVSLPLVVVLAAGGPFLLRVFGREFVAAYPVLLVLLASGTVNALFGGLWGTALTMTGFQKEAFGVVLVVATLNLGLTVVLTPRFGITGAASATTAAVFVRAAIVAWLVRRRLGFWPFFLGRSAGA